MLSCINTINIFVIVYIVILELKGWNERASLPLNKVVNTPFDSTVTDI